MTSVLDGDTKVCTRCKQTKEYHFFWNKKQKRYSNWCQVCQELGRQHFYRMNKGKRKYVKSKVRRR